MQNDCNMSGRSASGRASASPERKGASATPTPTGAPSPAAPTARKSWNNCASSIYNNKSEHSVNLWETISDKGGLFCVATMTGYSDFTQHTSATAMPSTTR